jgi:hypothetical protein
MIDSHPMNHFHDPVSSVGPEAAGNMVRGTPHLPRQPGDGEVHLAIIDIDHFSAADDPGILDWRGNARRTQSLDKPHQQRQIECLSQAPGEGVAARNRRHFVGVPDHGELIDGLEAVDGPNMYGTSVVLEESEMKGSALKLKHDDYREKGGSRELLPVGHSRGKQHYFPGANGHIFVWQFKTGPSALLKEYLRRRVERLAGKAKPQSTQMGNPDDLLLRAVESPLQDAAVKIEAFIGLSQNRILPVLYYNNRIWIASRHCTPIFYTLLSTK